MSDPASESLAIGVSRTPVRETLYRLQREGYIDASAHVAASEAVVRQITLHRLHSARTVPPSAAERCSA